MEVFQVLIFLYIGVINVLKLIVLVYLKWIHLTVCKSYFNKIWKGKKKLWRPFSNLCDNLIPSSQFSSQKTPIFSSHVLDICSWNLELTFLKSHYLPPTWDILSTTITTDPRSFWKLGYTLFNFVLAISERDSEILLVFPYLLCFPSFKLSLITGKEK